MPTTTQTGTNQIVSHQCEIVNGFVSKQREGTHTTIICLEFYMTEKFHKQILIVPIKSQYTSTFPSGHLMGYPSMLYENNLQ